MKKLLSVLGGFWCTFLRFYFEKRKSIATQFDVRPSSTRRALPECKIVMGLCRRREKSPSTIFYKTLCWSKKNQPGNSRERDNSERVSKARPPHLFFAQSKCFPPIFPSRASRPKRSWWSASSSWGTSTTRRPRSQYQVSGIQISRKKQDIKYLYIYSNIVLPPSSDHVWERRLSKKKKNKRPLFMESRHGRNSATDSGEGQKIFFSPVIFGWEFVHGAPLFFCDASRSLGGKGK